MKKLFKREVRAGLNRTNLLKPRLINDSDLQHLPPIVKKYLDYVEVVGKEGGICDERNRIQL